jgi:hypothetical protein
MKTFLLIGLVCIIGLLPLMAAAQVSVTGNECQANNGTDISSLPRCINQIYIWALGVGALLALLMTVVGGYYYMTAGGNAEQSAKGQEYIWSSIIGLVLLFGAYLILRTINPDLVEFKIPTGTCIQKVGTAETSTKLDADTKEACEAAGGFWYSYVNSTPSDDLLQLGAPSPHN